MKNHITLVEQYFVQQKEHELKKITKNEKLKLQINQSKEIIYDLRVNIRNRKFEDNNEEIQFFKSVKPTIYADFIFYNNQLKYQVSKPNSTNSILKGYLKNELKKLEAKKRKNLEFYRYYKHKSTFLDHIYFLRKNKQLELFSTDISVHLDSEFYTSHDTLAAEVIVYDMLTNFYKKEINTLKNISSGIFDDNNKALKTSLQWTASKTDLVELIYALKVSGAINTGYINTKDLITQLSTVFNIDIPNSYKTYSEIKNRSQETTKFLNKLTANLQEKLDYDDGL
ncbi:RteC domain-containing protein [Polaribacter atrinae]|uniref:RteC domain-containing protein n=1 Tax=Polaribacter atrinae TaxID=1333662 RepID=UPI00248F6936|nr:RteC domain-containing protein [Polaribacter atrinae]